MSPAIRLMGMVLIAALGGCSTQTYKMEIHTTPYPGAVIPESGTFGWMRSSGKVPKDPRIDQKAVDMRIRRAVENELSAKGYTLQTSGKPDLVVGYHMELEDKLDAGTVARKYGYGPALYGSSYYAVYEKGSIVIYIGDYGKQKLLWRGVAEARIIVSVSEEEKAERAGEAIRRILEHFPPNKDSEEAP